MKRIKQNNIINIVPFNAKVKHPCGLTLALITSVNAL